MRFQTFVTYLSTIAVFGVTTISPAKALLNDPITDIDKNELNEKNWNNLLSEIEDAGVQALFTTIVDTMKEMRNHMEEQKDTIKEHSKEMNEMKSIMKVQETIIKESKEDMDSLKTEIKKLEVQLKNLMNDSIEERLDHLEEMEKINDVMFAAIVKKDYAYYIPPGKIVFDSVIVDLGNDFDASTGTFTVSKSGTYLFIVDGLANGNNGFAQVLLAVNDASMKQFDEHNDGSAFFGIHGNYAANLEAGDVVYLYNERDDVIYGYGVDTFTFMGILMSEAQIA